MNVLGSVEKAAVAALPPPAPRGKARCGHGTPTAGLLYREEISTSTVPITAPDWQAVADQLAGALREAMLRNPALNAGGWARAHAALGRYEDAAGTDSAELNTPADPPQPP